MVERIGSGGSLAREAILAALRSRDEKQADVRALADAVRAEVASPSAPAAEPAQFVDGLRSGLEAVDQGIRRVDELPSDLVAGRVQDFHEVAVELRRAEFGFRFAMEVRNKLIDAYREVMRMNV